MLSLLVEGVWLVLFLPVDGECVDRCCLMLGTMVWWYVIGRRLESIWFCCPGCFILYVFWWQVDKVVG